MLRTQNAVLGCNMMTSQQIQYSLRHTENIFDCISALYPINAKFEGRKYRIIRHRSSVL